MYKNHERVLNEIYALDQVNPLQDPHTLKSKILLKYFSSTKFTFAKLAVNKTHS
jgi:hypothetical protein